MLLIQTFVGGMECETHMLGGPERLLSGSHMWVLLYLRTNQKPMFLSYCFRFLIEVGKEFILKSLCLESFNCSWNFSSGDYPNWCIGAGIL